MLCFFFLLFFYEKHYNTASCSKIWDCRVLPPFTLCNIFKWSRTDIAAGKPAHSSPGCFPGSKSWNWSEARSHFIPYLYHLALALYFAHLHLGIGSPDCYRGKGVGWNVRAKWPLEQIFYRVTLWTEGYETFSRMSCESMAMVTKCKGFSINEDYF